MFSKIPTRFSAPFGLLGDEAKLAFPSQPDGLLKLANVRVWIVVLHICKILISRLEHFTFRLLLGAGEQSRSDSYRSSIHAFRQYFTLFDSASEVFSLITPHHSAL